LLEQNDPLQVFLAAYYRQEYADEKSDDWRITTSSSTSVKPCRRFEQFHKWHIDASEALKQTKFMPRTNLPSINRGGTLAFSKINYSQCEYKLK